MQETDARKPKIGGFVAFFHGMSFGSRPLMVRAWSNSSIHADETRTSESTRFKKAAKNSRKDGFLG
jgi:hypothetical protein